LDQGGKTISEDRVYTEGLRALLARKALADARHRTALAALLGVPDTDVLAIHHLAWAGALTTSALGAQLGLTSGGSTALVQRLEREGFVAREPHPSDRRSTLLRLTERAEREAGAHLAPLVDDLDTTAAALEAPAREAVERYLERVAALAERHAAELTRAAEDHASPLPRVPVPGLWA
jgi:DNA-binding MarR family transcriptional regulator